MNYYLAPLEGITTYIYRNTYHSMFAPMDKYFTPFLVPRPKKGFSSRELNDILPEHNQGLFVVPQLLTNRAEDFIYAARMLADAGYGEVNVNLGCPSGTVVPKGKGAGFLAHPAELERFLDEIFSKTKARISIKTRIGRDEPEEFQRLLEIYGQYPLEELIIHPRVQKDFYKNKPKLEAFEEAAEKMTCPLCYNGDICTREDAAAIEGRFPTVTACMIGRGIIANPGLLGEIKGQEEASRKQLRRFHDRLYEEYRELHMGDKNVLFKMKEIWCYLGQAFPGCEKLLKRIRKAERLDRYEEVVNQCFEYVF